MVKKLSQHDQAKIDQAVISAERKTSAELVVLIAPRSDTYNSYILLYGLFIGSMIALILWFLQITILFPALLLVQLTCISCLQYIPFLRNWCIAAIPKKILHLRAKQRAYEEFLTLTQPLPSSVPVAVLYLSVAEHYVHILTSRNLQEKIAYTEWASIITHLTQTLPKQGIAVATSHAVEQISKLLATHFPDDQGVDHIASTVIEIEN